MRRRKELRTRRIFTDDDMDVSTSPLPQPKMDGIDNTDLNITEIGNFKKTHTPEQVEPALHDWYDEV